MRIKLLTSAVLAGLYAFGSGAAAGISPVMPSGKVGVLQPIKATAAELKAFQKELVDSNSLMQNDGLNVQVRSQHNKFTEEPDVQGEQVYIVRLQGAPAAVVRSELQKQAVTKGLMSVSAKTLPSSLSAQVDSYKAKMVSQQAAVLSQVQSIASNATMRHQFSEALNGFTVKMTQDQAREVSKLPQVASVERSKLYQLRTDAGPQFIKADQVWNGDAGTGLKAQGEGIVVGIIDTGINSDNPAFSDHPEDGYVYPAPAGGYLGDCAGDAPTLTCNNKLIGVRSYAAVTDLYSTLNPAVPHNGEDYQGHGSHTASTVAGNVMTHVPFLMPNSEDNGTGDVLKADFFPRMSGVAPHAQIIAYQVCYPSNDAGYNGCPGEAILAGIEDAIKDKVDVINFSIGGSDSPIWTDDTELAFLAAREAGINVAAAAGNSGQAGGAAEYFGALDNAAPWLINVAASTHNREVVVETTATDPHFIDPALGSEVPKWTELTGGGLNKTSVTGVVVRAQDYTDSLGQTGTSATTGSAYCRNSFPAGTFDNYPAKQGGGPILDETGQPAKVIVVCARGNLNDPTAVARTLKADNVKAGGADGFILYNYGSADAVYATASYSLPALHLSYGAYHGDNTNGYYGLEDWIDSTTEHGHALTINATTIERRIDDSLGDWLAAFSSRGPSYSNPEVMAPMVSAPGVNIYAAFADQHPFNAAPSNVDFTLLSGTSMATPHVAGAMALLRQVHPDWTAAEVQSSLMMTAEETVKYHRLNQETGDVGTAGIYRVGSGRINVASAADAGLVMDVTGDEFHAADPDNGGVVHKLNMPYLFNFSCKPDCQWVRTVTATKDGTWKVSNAPVTSWSFDMRQELEQNGVTIETIPSEFSLKAGESQTILVKAHVMDTQDWFSNSEVELHTDLMFEEMNGAAPNAHWPMAFKYDGGDLPPRIEAKAHDDTGSQHYKGLNLGESASPMATVYAPVKADIKEVTLPKDDDGYFPWASTGMDDPAIPMSDRIDEATHTDWIDVPAGTKRLVLESHGTVDSPLNGTSNKGNALVYLGKDYNGDGVVDTNTELLCVSNHIAYDNFCNINNPEPGKYWAVIYNPRKVGAPSGTEETFSYSFTAVGEEAASNLQMTLDNSDPANGSGDLNWDIPGMMAGDVYYSAIDVGTSANNPSDIGRMDLKLVRGADHVSLQVGDNPDKAKTGAAAGEVVPYTLQVLANNSGSDRAFTLTTPIPEGLKVTADDVMLNRASAADVKLENGVLTISGVQPDTTDVAPHYAVTSNDPASTDYDAMCKTPDFGGSNPGGYVNLRDFGITPVMGGFDSRGNADYRYGNRLTVNLMLGGYYDSFHLYDNQDDDLGGKMMGIRGSGLVDFMGQPWMFPFHDLFPNSGPFQAMAPLWRNLSYFNMSQGLIQSVELTGTSGISVANTGPSGWGIIEWDKAKSYYYGMLAQPQDDSFDFETIFNANTRFGDGQYEIYYAYDNVNFGSTDGRGSIGLQGYRGLYNTYGPFEGIKGLQIGEYDGLDKVVKSGKVICMDYQGPEQSQFEVTVWAKVADDAAGKTINWQTTSQVEGMADTTLAQSLSVPSNITLGAIQDQVTDEDTALEGLQVIYADEKNTKDVITVSGEHISATVGGNDSGSTVDILPEANFSGSTEVTVTVADMDNPSDSTSTRFMLTVNPVNDAPVAALSASASTITEGDSVTLDASGSTDPDGDTLTYSWEGDNVSGTGSTITVTGLGAGSHDFTVTLSDGVLSSTAKVTVQVNAAATTEQPKSSGGGGSVGLFGLLGLAALAGRRRKLH
ncbi:S8 family serine peptidase [Gallaecimonas kandeliae]|uniref:S8 family serine peptidase n=1 Tax=Gallaecimonas kandeliae TaxID=3029055 RepID=UPI002647584C|nr:S8 family serine peptidase [Gallaecimonas kandeliae]WKE67011.1 S8 family serine peptidase [Gallaecimonas kandeliae]